MFPVAIGLMLLVFLIVAAIPRWGFNQKWGYGPSIFLGLVLVVVVVLLALGYIPADGQITL